MKTAEVQLKRKIRGWLLVFMIGLMVSGITAFPLESELAFAAAHASIFPAATGHWLNGAYEAVRITNLNYPYLSYGTDWLAFAHIIIAIAFIGPLRNPVRNIWILQFGMIACLAIIPLALIAGPVRHIPVYWQLVDCCFSIGIIPLHLCYRYTKKLEYLQYRTT